MSKRYKLSLLRFLIGQTTQFITAHGLNLSNNSKTTLTYTRKIYNSNISLKLSKKAHSILNELQNLISVSCNIP
jgi:hypothetical protein